MNFFFGYKVGLRLTSCFSVGCVYILKMANFPVFNRKITKFIFLYVELLSRKFFVFARAEYFAMLNVEAY